MASTELQLGIEHLAGCLALSRSANWNQNEADWRLMLGFGHGWGLAIHDGTLVASTLVLPYNGFAWVAMVLVHPEHRKKGFATRLLRTALADLHKTRRAAILDATPAGHDVYAQEGFVDCWGFRRYALTVPATEFLPGEKARPMEKSDWPKILELDAKAFGANREMVLRNLAQRLPRAALVAERGGRIAGFLFGRDGREAHHLGPLVARDERAACNLLGTALQRVEPTVYLDLADGKEALRKWLERCGFVLQRPFTRMAHGLREAPGESSLVCCPAGPELG